MTSNSKNTVRVLLRTPRSCYATCKGARAAALRMFKKGDNVVSRNGIEYEWTMDDISVQPGGGFWGGAWVCYVELPADGHEPTKEETKPVPCSAGDAKRIAEGASRRTSELLAEHGRQILADAFAMQQAERAEFEALIAERAGLAGYGFRPC